MIYTDKDLSQFIACPKKISQPPRIDMREDGAHLRNGMEFESTDGKHGFRVFMRQNMDLPENFSIGMDYLPKDEPGSFCLIRYNGTHGGNKAQSHHLTCHIHRSSAEDVNAGLRVARHIEQTGKYAVFRDALRCFLLAVNVQAADLSQYFSSLAQPDLFKGDV